MNVVNLSFKHRRWKWQTVRNSDLLCTKFQCYLSTTRFRCVIRKCEIWLVGMIPLTSWVSLHQNIIATTCYGDLACLYRFKRSDPAVVGWANVLQWNRHIHAVNYSALCCIIGTLIYKFCLPVLSFVVFRLGGSSLDNRPIYSSFLFDIDAITLFLVWFIVISWHFRALKC